jgi:transposase, IS6 family
VKVARRWVYLYRAIDQYGQVIDFVVSERRDLAATHRFFIQALDHGAYPSAVTTDKAPDYPPGHAFIQNVRRGHYELGSDTDPKNRLTTAFTELALAI